MLTDILRDACREIAGQMAPSEPTTTVHGHRPAANASNIARTDMQARRHRRQRRLERTGQYTVGGWTVRTW